MDIRVQFRLQLKQVSDTCNLLYTKLNFKIIPWSLIKVSEQLLLSLLVIIKCELKHIKLNLNKNLNYHCSYNFGYGNIVQYLCRKYIVLYEAVG